ncbi:MAG: SH3 domain-containing protein [Anaerolineae bacterium]|nr:SH3 domain-containing protein [Anaerolineae bacterium]
MKKLFFLLLLLVAQPVFAQDSVTLNENILGEVTRSSPVYAFTSPTDRPLVIQVSSLSRDFSPVIILYDSNERLLQRAPNPTGLVQHYLIFKPQIDADYLIQILGVDGRRGQFVLTITEQSFVNEPIELRENADHNDRVTVDEPVKIYRLKASPTTRFKLEISTSGSAVVLSDPDGTIYGTASQNLMGSQFLIPPSLDEKIYLVTVYHSGIERREPFTIRLLLDESATGQTPISSTTPTAPLLENTLCAVIADGTVPVNIRRGPGTDFGVMGGLPPGQSAPVIGRTSNSQWWQIEYPQGLWGGLPAKPLPAAVIVQVWR